MKDERVLIVIPARKNSSFPGKNLYPLAGRPLIHYTFDASEIEDPHKTLVTSDDHYVIAEAEVRGYMTDRRPEALCTSDTTLDAVMAYVWRYHREYAWYILLPPTSPLRTKSHVEQAFARARLHNADSLISVVPEYKSLWKNEPLGPLYANPIIPRNKNRQEENPFYIANGAIFITQNLALARSKKKVSGKTIIFSMKPEESLDIHGLADIEVAEYYLNKKGGIRNE